MKPSPGEEVAAFSTTSRFLYSGLVRSSSVCGGAIFLSAK